MTDYPDDEDGAVLAEMAAQGVDMNAPLLIDFPIVASDEASAQAIADALNASGYPCEIYFDEGEPDEDGEIDADEEFAPYWGIITQREMVPIYDDLVCIQAELKRIVEPFGGEVDGWGVMLDAEEEEETEE